MFDSAPSKLWLSDRISLSFQMPVEYNQGGMATLTLRHFIQSAG